MSSAPPLNERIFRSTDRISHPALIKNDLSRPDTYRKWTNSDTLKKACESIHHDGMSIRRAAEEYGIPRSTLHDYVTGKVVFGSKSGPRAYLTPNEEEELVTFLSGMSSLGYSRTVNQTVEIVQAVVNAKGINVTVTSSWWKSFKSRHRDIVLRNPETLTHSRINGASDANIENYFDLLEKTIYEAEINDRPCQIFNLDESGFPLSPNPPRVIAKKGYKHPSTITSSERSQITVLSCCNAGGYALPPLVIFDRKTLKIDLTHGEVPGTMYGLSDSGWMDAEIFEWWFKVHFLVYAPPARPLLLLMDGHSSHFSPAFVNKAAEEHVIVFCLPPHSTHKTQPLDKGVFGPLKKAWREECHSYMVSNPGKVVTRYQFSQLFNHAWMRAMTPHNIISGFSTTGVYPIDRYKVLTKSPPKYPTICERTGLKFIPLLTPLRHSVHLQSQTANDISVLPSYQGDESISGDSDNDYTMFKESLPYEDCSSTEDIESFDATYQPFTNDEIVRFTKRKAEGYDIKTDARYNHWLSLQDEERVFPPSQLQPHPHTVLSKLISTHNPPEQKIPAIPSKSSARVLTSNECRKEINEKAKRKEEALRQKEERKINRQRKKEEKQKILEEKQKSTTKSKGATDTSLVVHDRSKKNGTQTRATKNNTLVRKRRGQKDDDTQKENTCSNISLVGRRGQKDDTQNEDTCSNISLVGRRRGQKDDTQNEDTCSNISLVGRRRGQKADDTQNEDTCSNISLVGRRRGQKDDTQNEDTCSNISLVGRRGQKDDTQNEDTCSNISLVGRRGQKDDTQNEDTCSNISLVGRRRGQKDDTQNEDTCSNISLVGRRGQKDDTQNEDTCSNISLVGRRRGQKDDTQNEDTCSNISLVGRRRGQKDDDIQKQDTCSNVSLVGRRRGQKADDTQKEDTCSNISLVGRRGQKDADTQKDSCITGKCSHPRATSWIMCSQCEEWLHCICVRVPHTKAKTDNFVFICKKCK